MPPESVSVAEASHRLGISVPTVKAMYRRGEIAGFLTPGRHLRISTESLDSVRANGRGHSPEFSAPSSTLKARRERIEFMNLEGEELRAKRQLRQLQREDAEEEEERAAEKLADDLDREERLEAARASRLREERLQVNTAAEQRRAKLRQSVQFALSVAGRNLTLEQQRELAEALDGELQRANIEDPESAIPVIKAVCERFTTSLVNRERDRQRRERIVQWARFQIAITSDSTKTDEAEAIAAARTALAQLSSDVPEQELRSAVQAAIEATRKKLERRHQRQEAIKSAVREVDPYLERLKLAGGIEFDFSSANALKQAVRTRLESELTDQSTVELRRLVHEIVDGEIEQNGL